MALVEDSNYDLKLIILKDGSITTFHNYGNSCGVDLGQEQNRMHNDSF